MPALSLKSVSKLSWLVSESIVPIVIWMSWFVWFLESIATSLLLLWHDIICRFFSWLLSAGTPGGWFVLDVFVARGVFVVWAAVCDGFGMPVKFDFIRVIASNAVYIASFRNYRLSLFLFFFFVVEI